MIGCDCATCRSDDPRDHRTRASVLIRFPRPSSEVAQQFQASAPDDATPTSSTTGTPAAAGRFNAAQAHRYQVLIDPGPDLRAQALRHRLSRLDAVVYTHTHADHVFGTDDLRRFNAVMDEPLPIYAEPDAIDTLQGMFRYIFQPHTNVNKSFIASLLPHPVTPGKPFELFGATWTPLRLMHGRLPILGFRVEYQDASLAYCTDVSNIPPQTYPLLANLDLLVLDGLRFRHHPTHLTIQQACDIADQLAPRQTLLTHLAHDIKHADVEVELPENVKLAYDGLHVSLAVTQSRTLPRVTSQRAVPTTAED